MKFQDLTGQKFNHLTVIERAPNIGKNAAWRCKCDCGNEVLVSATHLKIGHSKSCGCLKNKGNNKKHGMCYSSIYTRWNAMIQRCENPNNEAFDRYGGRGIKVCERWHIFENFYEDVSKMEHFNENGYSLERRDNDKGYCAENCCWATPKQQSRNRRSNTKVEYNGEKMTLAEAAEKSGINYGTLCDRHQRGLRGEELFKPVEMIRIGI